MIADKSNMLSTIQKTIFTARLIDGFWDRWIAHGIHEEDVRKVRPLLVDKESWIRCWSTIAGDKAEKASCLVKTGDRVQAETLYRTAGLYYQLVQWLIPEGGEKRKWMEESVQSAKDADQLSAVSTDYVELPLDGRVISGRIRRPIYPQGLIIMVNPIDSAKEELFSYETDFEASGFITLNFDGPGQGETLSFHHLKATQQNWSMYVDSIIKYARKQFPDMPIHLFGTSSGAAWSIYGSCHPSVSKAAVVSPAFTNETIQMPDYFIERLSYITENQRAPLPNFSELSFSHPVYLFHGKQDVMVSDQNIYSLYKQFSSGSKLKEYEEEGHCCNFKLGEIRQKSMAWFSE